MKVRAPGKLLLTGAYAVLEGAPAIVVAVNRHAVAGGEGTAEPIREVRAAFEGERAPYVDVSALHEGETKLGLGSSAAALVAALGWRAHAKGQHLNDPAVRGALFVSAREVHARVQAGGSGVDVAASTFGGALRYRIDAAGAGGAEVHAVELPAGLVMQVHWTGTSARTTDLRARVDALRASDRRAYDACFGALAEAAHDAAYAVDRGDVSAFVGAARATQHALAALGRAADAPIVSGPMSDLAALAEGEGAAYLPSGAGGGDCAVWLGESAPSPRFLERARAFGMRPLPIEIDRRGVSVFDEA